MSTDFYSREKLAQEEKGKVRLSALTIPGPPELHRAVHIFPKLPNVGIIQELRAKYDPLSTYIPPHITLVFPFGSTLPSSAVEEHVRTAVRGARPFCVVLCGITGTLDRFLYLNVKKGNDDLVALHDRLYSGAFQSLLRREFTYIPHLTIGRFRDEEAFLDAIRATEGVTEKFETEVSSVVVEVISRQGHSFVETEIFFG